MRRASRVRVQAIILILLLGVPLVAAGGRVVIHFATSFSVELPGPPALPSIVAAGGVVQIVGQPDVFVPTVDAAGDGVLRVLPNPTATAAELDAVLHTPFSGNLVDVFFALEPVGSFSELDFWALDDSGGTMIDAESDGDEGDPEQGVFRVGSTQVAYPESTTGRYDVRLTLRDPSFGGPIWMLAIKTEFGGEIRSTSATGPLKISGKLTLGSWVMVRPAGATGGAYEIDDLVISSPSTSNLANF